MSIIARSHILQQTRVFVQFSTTHDLVTSLGGNLRGIFLAAINVYTELSAVYNIPMRVCERYYSVSVVQHRTRRMQVLRQVR